MTGLELMELVIAAIFFFVASYMFMLLARDKVIGKRLTEMEALQHTLALMVRVGTVLGIYIWLESVVATLIALTAILTVLTLLSFTVKKNR